MKHRPAAFAAAILAVLCLAGCGQKGALYLPEAASEVVTRPTQTQAESPSAGAGETRPEDESPPREPSDH